MAEWLAVKEVASRVGVSPTTVVRWIQDGVLRASKAGGKGRWFVRRDDVEYILVPTTSRPRPRARAPE